MTDRLTTFKSRIISGAYNFIEGNMKNRYRRPLLSLTIILTLLISMVPLGAVKAEGEDPAPTDMPQAETQPGAEATSSTEWVLAPIEDATPVSTEVAPPTTGEPSTPAPTVEDMIAQAPEGVVVIPVDPAGEALPMAEEATAKSYVIGDPVYCPINVSFGDPLCIHYDTIDEAIDQSMSSGGGTVYVEAEYRDSNPNPIFIDGSIYTLGSVGYFSLIGGVDISTGNIVGTTSLTRPIEMHNIDNFNMENFSLTSTLDSDLFSADNTNGNISISHSQFEYGEERGFSIEVTGDVTLDTVEASNNWGINFIRSSGGNLKITNSQFNDNFYSGLVAITKSGEIWAINNEALRNDGVGFVLSSGGNLHYCSNYAALNLNGGATVTSRRTI
jgi:hypothetical protein